MSTVTTDAILLRTHPYSESSRILRFLTRELGLVSVMAKGVRRGASRGYGGAGAFSEGVAVFLYRETRDLQTLREFAPVNSRFGLARDVPRLAGASAAAELVLRHTLQEPHPELYRTISAGLDRLEAAAPREVLAQVLALAWNIVHTLGFGPELGFCLRCGRSLDADEMGWFEMRAGGVGGACCDPSGGSRRIGPQARKQLKRLLAGDPPGSLRGRRAHISLLRDFTSYHVLGGDRLSSLRFLEPGLAGQGDGPGH